MTLDELRSLYTEAVKIIRAERKMREYVFRSNSEKLAEKLAEIDRLLEIVTRMKDELKEHCEPGYEQQNLIDVPAKYQ